MAAAGYKRSTGIRTPLGVPQRGWVFSGWLKDHPRQGNQKSSPLTGVWLPPSSARVSTRTSVEGLLDRAKAMPPK